MSRLTKQEVEIIKDNFHIGDCHYSRNLYVEKLVAEVEACWRERRNLKGKLKACQETMLSLSAKLAVKPKTSLSSLRGSPLSIGD